MSPPAASWRSAWRSVSGPRRSGSASAGISAPSGEALAMDRDVNVARPRTSAAAAMMLVELADAAGISAGELSRIERGTREMPFSGSWEDRCGARVRPSELLARSHRSRNNSIAARVN
jgi:hypothetical protein